MNLTIYGDDSAGLIKLDPRTKLLIFLSSSFLSLQSYRLVLTFAFGTLLCVIFALCGKWWLSLKCYLVFALFCYMRFVVERSGKGAGAVVTIVSMLCTVVLFSFPFIISFLLLAQTTRISQFLSAFEAMRMPAAIVIPIAVLFRFIPAVQEEWSGIRKAMSYRGIELGALNFLRSPFKTIEYMLIPLLFSSLSVMEELAASTLARGLDSGVKRTSYEEVKMGVADYVIIALMIVMAVLILRYGKALDMG